MAEIKKSLTIDATPGELFDRAEDPSKLPKFVPNVSDVVDIQRTERRIGDAFRVIYKVLGVTFDEQFTTTEYDRPTYLTTPVKGGMTATLLWAFEPDARQGHRT